MGKKERFKLGDILRSTEHDGLINSCYITVEAIIPGVENIYVLRRLYDGKVFLATQAVVDEVNLEKTEVNREPFKDLKPGDYFLDSNSRHTLVMARLGDALLLSEPTKSKAQKNLVKKVSHLLDDIEPVYGTVADFADDETKTAHAEAQEAVKKLKRVSSDRLAFKQAGNWMWLETAILMGFDVIKGEG